MLTCCALFFQHYHSGYGPFRGHSVNASWVAVKELKSMGLNDDTVDLHVYEIPVSYDVVKRTTPELWERHKPDVSKAPYQFRIFNLGIFFCYFWFLHIIFVTVMRWLSARSAMNIS